MPKRSYKGEISITEKRVVWVAAESRAEAVSLLENGKFDGEYTPKDSTEIVVLEVHEDPSTMYEIVLENGTTISRPSYTTLAKINRFKRVDIVTTLCNYLDSSIIRYWDFEIYHDSEVWDMPLCNLFDPDKLYTYFKSKRNKAYSKNRNGEYPFKEV